MVKRTQNARAEVRSRRTYKGKDSGTELRKCEFRLRKIGILAKIKIELALIRDESKRIYLGS